jgi:hypothetical protein
MQWRHGDTPGISHTTCKQGPQWETAWFKSTPNSECSKKMAKSEATNLELYSPRSCNEHMDPKHMVRNVSEVS